MDFLIAESKERNATIVYCASPLSFLFLRSMRCRILRLTVESTYSSQARTSLTASTSSPPLSCTCSSAPSLKNRSPGLDRLAKTRRARMEASCWDWRWGG